MNHKTYKITAILFLYPLWGFGGFCLSQSTSQNYIVTTVPTTQVSNSGSLTNDNSNKVIQYFDGLGRPIETVAKAITPLGKDLISTTIYDNMGRESQFWNPAPSTNSTGEFVDPTSFQTIQKTYYSDANPYSQTNYEDSPLNRVLSQYGPGASWYANNKKVSTTYDTNTANEVYCYIVNTSGQLQCAGTYTAAVLYKTTITDEDGKAITEYKNKLGQVVLKRSSSNVDTYYVYNDLNQLVYVLPPLAADALTTAKTYTDTDDALLKYGYLYKYDKWGNCICKRLPGCEPIYMVYDRADRLVLSQDGNQRVKTPQQWTVTKYDVLGRVIFTGTTLSLTGKTTTDLQTLYGNDLIVETCTSGVYSNTKFSDASPLTINYYDSYDFISNKPDPVTRQLGYDATQEANGYPAKYSSAKGLLTTTMTALLDNSGTFIATVLYYDFKGQVVQSRSYNFLNGFDIIYNAYNFSGKPIKTYKTHNISGQTAITELYTYSYDKALRPLITTYSINGGTPIILTDNTNGYDELGRLKTKKRHNGTDTERFDYNIRNWTTQINSGTYQEQLYYNVLPSGATGTACYNGNIAYQVTGNLSNMPIYGYSYTYDDLNRLFTGNAYSYTSIQGASAGHNEGFSYDKMGNITYLYRYGASSNGGSLDGLFFTYSGNQVKSIYDLSGSKNSYSIKEYQNKVNLTTEMTYDQNGNQIKDLDRDIVTIRYNLLNLPEYIQFKNGNVIKNLYNAGGQKLRSDYYTYKLALTTPIADNQVLNPVYTPTNYDYTGTAYIGNVEYLLRKGQSGTSYIDLISNYKVHNPEGYYYNSGNYAIWMDYFRRDHLGNIREVWRPAWRLGSTDMPASTPQTTQYYPSGLPWSESTGSSTQPYKYNGKEFVEMSGYDTYDYGARSMYAAIGRFSSVDPLCELKPWQSPYMYCSGNPINRIDPTGMADIDGGTKPEVPVIGHDGSNNSYDNYNDFNSAFQQLLDNANRNTPQIPRITPTTPTFNLPTNTNANNTAKENKKDSKKGDGTIETISTALSSVGIAADGAKIYTVNNAGKEIVYVTLKGTTAAVNATKVISVLKGISTATIVVGVVVDAVHVAVDPSYAGKAIVNTGVTVVATIIGATLSAPAGIVIGGGYLLLDQLGAFDRPTNIPYYNRPVCPQDNTRINIPYK